MDCKKLVIFNINKHALWSRMKKSSKTGIFLVCNLRVNSKSISIYHKRKCSRQSRENDERTWKLSSMVVVNQPKEKRTINTKWKKYLRNVPQESITGRKMNGNIYVHCSASTDHGFGCLRTLVVCTIQVQPSAWLLVDWICSGSGGGRWVAWVRRDTSLLHMIPHRPKLSRDSLYTSFLCTSLWAQLYT